VSQLERVLADVAREHSSFGNPWALVGGLAVSARTEPRFTRDIDFAIDVANDAEAEAVVRDLTARGYRLSASVEQDAVSRLATARMIPPGRDPDEVVVDLLFASSEIEPEVAVEADPLEILPGVSVPVAKAGHLLALKLLSRDDATRPQDALDIRALAARSTLTISLALAPPPRSSRGAASRAGGSFLRHSPSFSVRSSLSIE
jgi:hypothetical protein